MGDEHSTTINESTAEEYSEFDLDDLYADGGSVDVSPFEIKADTSVTKKEQIQNWYQEYVYTPISIMWHDWRARIGGLIILVYLILGLVGPVFVEPTHPNDGPPSVQWFETMAHPLGTDLMGHDLLAQTIHSTLPILQMITAGGLFTIIVGTFFGTVSGYKGGMVDTVLNTITDIFINIPGLPLVVVLAVLMRPENPYWIGILLTVAAWAGLARGIRSQVLTLRNESFTEASRTIGLSSNKIIVKDILPHLMPFILINLVNAARNVIFAAVGLYFLGVLPFTDTNWGIMLNQAYENGAMYRPELIHWLIVPMVAIIGISMGLILLAQSLDRVFNPRVRARHVNPDLADDEKEETNEVKSPEMMRQV